MGKAIEAGMEPLHTIKSTDPPLWLAPSENLSDAARKASQHLFSSLKPHAPKSPFDHLLVDGFDAEQIWQQIDLLSQPLLSNLRRQVKQFEKHPEVIGLVTEKKKGGVVLEVEKGASSGEKRKERLAEFDEIEMDMDEFDGEDEDEDDDEEEEEGEKSGSEEGESENGDEGTGEEKTGIEDKFLKIDELEEYMEDDEAREYGLDTKKGEKKKKNNLNEEDEEEDEEDEDEDDELDSEDADGENVDNARYEDFFGSKKKIVSKRKPKVLDGSDSDSGSGLGSGSDDEQNDERMDKKKGGLSTHEKQLQKLQSEIEQMEKANLEPKTWTMQGEVTAASRPKNSALEVDLDFEHNVRPAPVITEEVTQSIEDMIKDRIAEGRFDDIYKAPSLPATAPRVLKEMDENKSTKGLAEVYEDEYVQKTNPSAAPLTFSDEQKKEASLLFKQLCLKLDALSHFHFAPKPVIEDMSIQANVPALAMEEIAPMAVSDAAMLAPEEVFSGKGGIKEAAELTQEDRKRMRAKKKRKFKAESAKKMDKKPRADTALENDKNGEE